MIQLSTGELTQTIERERDWSVVGTAGTVAWYVGSAAWAASRLPGARGVAFVASCWMFGPVPTIVATALAMTG